MMTHKKTVPALSGSTLIVNLLLSTSTAVVGIMVSDDREGSVICSGWTLMIKELQLLLLVV